jgi:hypothetical protein
MYVHGTMRPVETVPGIEGQGGYRRMVEGVNSSMIYCKNLCKCHNVPLPSTRKKHKKDECFYSSFKKELMNPIISKYSVVLNV